MREGLRHSARRNHPGQDVGVVELQHTTPRSALLLLLVAAAALGLGACGGGSSSTSGSTSGKSVGAGSGGGRAESFLEPNADNSIPEFGAEAGAADRRRAGAALRAYLVARAGGEWATACSTLAAPVRRQIEGFAGAAKARGCAPVYAALSAGSAAATRADLLTGAIVALRIEGARGFALFYGPKGEGEKFVMPMLREGAAWKVSQLAPIAYPLGSQTPTSP